MGRHLQILVAALLLGSASAIDQIYCSSQNTGSDYPPATQPFQSQGLCFNQCKSQYAFAVVQGNNCWCSNYAPSQTTSLSSCSVACPGFPAEACGNAQAGLFGYIPTPLSPSGTIGSPGTISSPAASASTIMAVSTPSVGAPAESTLLSTLALSIVISTVLVKASSSLFESLVQSSSTSKILIPFEQTVTESPSPVTVLETVTASPVEQTSTASTLNPLSSTVQLPASSSLIPTSSTFATSTWIPTPYISATTITDGQIVTVTLTPTAPPPATTSVTQIQTNQGFFSDSSKVVPVFVVIGLLIVALCALCIWCIFLRRRKGEYPIDSNNSNSYGPSNRTPPTATPQRRSSRLSQLGFLGRSRSFSVERNLPQIQTNGLSASEKRPGNDSTTPTDRRSSFPMRFVDQRLDPVAVWNPLHSNGSHVSVSSFRDDRDYSRRMLRVANPDDE